ncbi:hypothetical protein IPZ68_37880 [Streptomyces arenae]|nr:hypothetical protein [Streptomyces arenae]
MEHVDRRIDAPAAIGVPAGEAVRGPGEAVDRARAKIRALAEQAMAILTLRPTCSN